MNRSKGVDRRAFLKAAGVAGAVTLVSPALSVESVSAAALTKAERDRMSPDDIIQAMKLGNERFRHGQRTRQEDYLAQRPARR